MNGLTPVCPYCGQFSVKVGGEAIYPHRSDLFHKIFYQCQPCDAYVGSHPGQDKPLGRLANSELRTWKKRAHAAFDPIWQNRFERRSAEDAKYKKGMARGGRYKKLAALMGIDTRDCHIGMFDIEKCQQVIEICNSGKLND